jgi:hypothetical protein
MKIGAVQFAFILVVVFVATVTITASVTRWMVLQSRQVALEARTTGPTASGFVLPLEHKIYDPASKENLPTVLNVSLASQVEFLDPMEAHYQFSHAHVIRGVVFVLHGCNRDAFDWFIYPEPAHLVAKLLHAGLHVVALAAAESRMKCWNSFHDKSRFIRKYPALSVMSTIAVCDVILSIIHEYICVVSCALL